MTTLADFVTPFLGIWSLWVMLMPTRIDENTPLLQGISYGETASGGTSTIAGIIYAAHSFFFLRRARIAAEARVAAEAALLRIVINTGWRVWTDGVGELQTKLKLTSNFLQREAIEDIDIFLADF